MIKWLKEYYTRKDSRIGFWKEDLKLNLISVGVILALCVGCKLVLDLKDRMDTKKRIEESDNEKLIKYMKSED